jgi:hypothetical protein
MDGGSYWMEHALRRIRNEYDDFVFDRNRDLLKFGQITSAGTDKAAIMGLAGSAINEVYATTNAITHLVSNDSNTQLIRVEGHYLDADNNLIFHFQLITLTGTTPVALSQPLARVTRLENKGITNLVDDSTVYAMQGTDVDMNGDPNTDAEAHITMGADDNQSLKAATAFSYRDYGLITEVYAGVNKKTTALVDIRLEVREQGGLFQTKFIDTVNTGGSGRFTQPFRPFLIVPKNADVRLTATASTTGVSVSGGFNVLLAGVKDLFCWLLTQLI